MGTVKRLALAAMLAVTVVAATWAGLLTNWFRYGLSLEDTVAVAPLVATTPMALIILGNAARTRRASGLALGIGVFAVGMVAATVAHRESFGTYLPDAAANDIESSGIATLETVNGTVNYRLDLYNPFARSHKEVLVVQQGTKTRNIDLPVFDHTPGGFGEAVVPEDWVIMTSTPERDVFIVTIGKSLLVSKTFRVNLASGKIVARRAPSNSPLQPTATAPR